MSTFLSSQHGMENLITTHLMEHGFGGFLNEKSLNQFASMIYGILLQLYLLIKVFMLKQFQTD